jgi:hypothetical protein
VIDFTESEGVNPYYDLTDKQNSLLGKTNKNIINVKASKCSFRNNYSLDVNIILENNMKGLNKLVLASAIAAISAGANAELKALDDSAMGELTGQAGLTIDIETQYTIGEFAYKDGGSVLFQGISMGGNTLSALDGGMLDNIRLNLDVAGGGAAGEDLHYGFSEITELAGMLVARGNTTNPGIQAVAAGSLSAVPGKADLNDKKNFGDGDLVIHIDATDHLKTGGGMDAFVAGTGRTLGEEVQRITDVLTGGSSTVVGSTSLTSLDLATAAELVHTAVDFNFSIDAIKLASSDYTIGSGAVDSNADGIRNDETGATQVTTLISDLSIKGFLGPVDIQIENNGNGFNAAGEADSKIHWDTYIDVTDLDVYIDIAGVKIENMKINNTRGDVTDINGNQSFGFAHSERTIYAVKDAVLHIDSAAALNGGTNVADYVDGIAINTVFKGDMEIGALSFGDTGSSIGELYWPDISSTTNWTISAH